MPSEAAEKDPLLGREALSNIQKRAGFTISTATKLIAAAVLLLVGAVVFVKVAFFAADAVEGAVDSLFECSANYTRSADWCNTLDAPVLEGVDVVAYFASGASASTLGSSLYIERYRDYTFYFKDATNQALFSLDPDRYAPKFGGFCAFGLSGEDPMNSVSSLGQLYTVPSSPDQFWVSGGALYLFRGEGAKDLFLADADALTAGADALWSTWFGDNCNGFYNTLCFM
jgi:hypothetical protein